MSCGPTSCPPTGPAPEARPTWTTPVPASCGIGRVYYNSAQTYVDVCSTGSPTLPISVTVLAFSYTSEVSQEAADDTALAAATEQAQALRALSPCQSAVSGSFLLLESGDFLVTESEDFFTI